MGRCLLACAVTVTLICVGLPTGAQRALAAGTISLSNLGTYTQNFDMLASAGTSDVVPNGWAFAESGTNANTLYTAGTGSGNSGDTYSFGASGSSERAFGTLRSGSLSPTIGVSFTNNTGFTITGLIVKYLGEQWRLGTANRGPDRLDFQYSADATSLTTGSWTTDPSFSFSSPVTTGTVGALDGNAVANRRPANGSIVNLAIPNGSTFWIRWLDVDVAGADDGLAIDDFELTPGVDAQPPAVMSTSPASGVTNVAVNSNVTLTFNQDVAVMDGWYGIACASSGSHGAAVTGGTAAYTLDPTNDFVLGEVCTVTVFAPLVRGVHDPRLFMSANYAFSFTTVAPPTAIHDIQGAGHISPKNGQNVSGVQGIVTAKRSNGFYMQDLNPDADPATSEGIFVFTSSSPTTVSVGDAVTVSGKVQEFRPGGASSGNLTTTELSGPTIALVSRGNPLPPPIVVGTGGRIPPSTVIEDDASGDVETSGTFDPASDGLDFWESLEGMLVQLNDAVAVGPTNAFGETPVIGDGGANANVRTARGGLLLRPDDGNPERLVADDSIVAMPKLNVGDGYSGPLVGVIDYNFGNFFLEVTVPVSRVDRGQQRETTAAPRLAQVAIATFNVQNLDPGDGPAKFDTLASLVVTNLRSPDLIGVEEIQDNSGPIDNGVVDADVTIQTLISAIRAAGGPTYDWRQISPVNDQDGGEPGGNIRQVFLFRTDRGLSFVDRPGGSSTTATTVQTGTGSAPQLSNSPGRIDPANAAWNTSRKPLAGEFLFRGHTLFVIVNHFNSKGGDQPLSGRFQPPTRGSELQRHQQAQIVNDFVDSILAADPNADVAVLGDFNDFEFSDTIHILEGGALSDLIETLPLNERYSYEFEGNAQVLDHILVSGHVRDHTPLEFDVVHVNAEFAVQASDHDPSVVRLVIDTVAPVFTSVPNDVAASTGAGATACGTVVSDAQLGTAVATDVDPSVVITRTGVPAGDVFPVGTTTITFTATDSSGNVATATQLVTVSDDTPPTVGAPGPVTVATGPGATTDVVVVSDAVLGSASFSDNCPGAVVSRSGVPAGNAFAVGTTTVTYAAIDPAHNTATAEQLVTVVDNTPPTIIGSATTSPNANGWYKAPVTVHFTCSDNAPGVTCPPDEVLGEGAAQSLTRTATDVAGNTASATVGPVNVDLHAPVIAFGGNAPSYTVDQAVAITCAVRDDLSGLATSTCPTEGRPAYAIGLGAHTLTATATDRAGNQSTLSIAFTVVANETSLCALTRKLVTKPAIASSLCAKLTAAAAAAERGNADAHDGAIGAYVNELDAQRGKSISGPNADVLIVLARTL